MTAAIFDFRFPRLALLTGAVLLAAASDWLQAQEQNRHASGALEQANQLGLLKGMVQVELIRPDMLSVTIDGGLGRGRTAARHGRVALQRLRRGQQENRQLLGQL